MKYCHNCGNQIEEHMKFCGKCGTMQHAEINISQTSIKRRKGKTGVLVMLVLICLVVAGGLAVWIMQGRSHKGVAEPSIDETAMENAAEIMEENDAMTEAIIEQEVEYTVDEEEKYDEIFKLIGVNEQFFDENGNMYWEYEERYRCSEKGEYQSGEMYSINSDGSVDEGRIKFVYNEDGTYLSIVEFWDGNKNEILRDNNENMLYIKRYNSGGVIVYEEWYDDNGNTVSKREYNSDGTILYEALYDIFGNVTERNWPEGAESYYWDKNGEKIEIRIYKEKSSYDEYGNLLEYASYDDAGKRKSYSRWENSYDEHGNLVETTAYDANEDYFYRENMSYDEYNNLIMHIEYDITGKMTINETYQYQYDANGNMLLKKHYSEGKMKSEEKYDIHGNVIESLSYDEDGVLYDKSVKTYDDHGNLLTTYRYGENNLLSYKQELKYQVFKVSRNELR